jgi:hypothetical protein
MTKGEGWNMGTQGLALRKETLLTIEKYERMVMAIRECFRVDEVKEMRDQAEAIRVYALQAGNFGVERLAELIRLRAEHRAGELLTQAKADGRLAPGRPTTNENGSTMAPFLESVGVTKKQSSIWREFAAIPWWWVEENVRKVKRPTALGLIVKHTGKPGGVQEPFPKTISVDFYSAEDMKEFGEKIGQVITMATTSISYPKPAADFIVHFETSEDIEDFSEKIGQKITLATRKILISGDDMDKALAMKA